MKVKDVMDRVRPDVCCQSAKLGHFEAREGYCYEECRASSLRVLLLRLLRSIVWTCTSFLRCRICSRLPLSTSAGVTLPRATG